IVEAGISRHRRAPAASGSSAILLQRGATAVLLVICAGAAAPHRPEPDAAAPGHLPAFTERGAAAHGTPKGGEPDVALTRERKVECERQAARIAAWRGR